MKWHSSSSWKTARRGFARLGAASLAVVLGSLLLTGSASAGAAWDADILTVADLQAGGAFLSDDGQVAFSDFEFTAVGFDDSAFDEFLVQPRDGGFRLILGFGDLFGPGALEMQYTATASPSYALDGAAIPALGLFEAVGASPLLEVEWEADNGASLFGSSDDTANFPRPGVSVSFDPVLSLIVEEIVMLSGGSGIAKVDHEFSVVEDVPEPTSGVLIALALSGALALGARRER